MGKFIVTQMAAVAELEAGLISKRTKDALAASKARRQAQGKPLLGGYRGGPKIDPVVGLKVRQERAVAYTAAVRPVVTELRNSGLSLRKVCDELQTRGIRTPNGGKWVPQMVTKIVGASMKGAA
jgi:DNA invertase Pin-like site-specific DNA recombinase